MYNPKEYRIPPYVPSPSGMKGMAHIGATNLTMLSGRLSIEYILLASLEQGTLTCPKNMPPRPPPIAVSFVPGTKLRHMKSLSYNTRNSSYAYLPICIIQSSIYTSKFL